MRHYLGDAADGIDAAIFSGDVLYNKDEREELKKYVERWIRAINEQESFELTADTDE